MSASHPPLTNIPSPASHEGQVLRSLEDTAGHESHVWARLDEEGRTAWLDAARLRAAWHYPLPATDADEFIVEGAHVTDAAALYCALGEAMNGPGGYYGANLDALKDCLRGNFGPVAPFTLTWHNSSSAETVVPEAMAEVLRVLRAAKVTTHLT
nr:barstar family protein [Streptomyces tubbatahanensis]